MRWRRTKPPGAVEPRTEISSSGLEEYSRIDRALADRAREGTRRFRLCGICHELYEPVPAPGFPTPQRCRCRPSDKPTWPRFDYNEHLRLCECCRLEPLKSGSRWSVWFCEECKGRVLSFNHLLGRYAIPIGRHSMMGGISLHGPELASADDERLNELIDRFADVSQGLWDAMDRLREFAADRTVVLARGAGLVPERDIRLTMWLQRLGRVAQAEPLEFGKEGSFEALVRWFAGG
jgi:hypothetical protein